MPPKVLYDIRNITHKYEDGPVTVDIGSLEVTEGSVTGLVGPNGSGKSTLLKILAFLEPLAGGQIFFDGEDSACRPTELRRSVTYLLQDSYLLKRSVYENIAYGLRLRGATCGMKERIYDSLRRVGLDPEEFAERRWYRLSGGEVQRAALASRLALHPKVLLLDEPTANVDEASAQLVKDAAMSAWREWGTTVIIATHDLQWLYEVSTDIISLYYGRVIGRGVENMITGEWRVNGRYALRLLPDGQRVIGLRGSADSIAAAVLSPDKINISQPEQPSGEKNSNTVKNNTLKGIVTQMALERGTESVLLSVDVCGLMLKARTTVQQATRCGIFPASGVTLSFSASDVRWLEKSRVSRL